jgi:hypothetical protein
VKFSKPEKHEVKPSLLQLSFFNTSQELILADFIFSKKLKLGAEQWLKKNH